MTHRFTPKGKSPAKGLGERSDAFLRALMANERNDAALRDSAARILLARAGAKPNAPAGPPARQPGSNLEYEIARMLSTLGIPLASIEMQPAPIQIAEKCQSEPDLGFIHPVNGRRVIVEVKGLHEFGDESRVKFKISSRLNPDWWFLWVKLQTPSTRTTKAGALVKKNPFLIELWSNGRCMRPNCANLAEALGLKEQTP